MFRVPGRAGARRFGGPLFLLMVLLASGAAMSRVAGQTPSLVVDPVTRVGAYVQQYYSRAQSIVAEETVVLQPLQSDLTAEGFARRLVYDLRVDWNPHAPGDERATVRRELVSAKGPALGPPKQPDCMDPRSVSPEPLAFL